MVPIKNLLTWALLATSLLLSASSALVVPVEPSQEGLSEYVVGLKARIPRAGTEAFVLPAAKDLEAFERCVVRVLEGESVDVEGELAALGYVLRELDDPESAKSYIILEERSDPPRGQGTYVVDPTFERDLVLSVPHPIYDTGTLEEGARLLRELGARALFVAGTHRCANAASSGCSGSTSACGGGPYKASDAAHQVRGFFQAAHAAGLRLDHPPRVLSVHGQSSESVDVVLSDGTSSTAPADSDVAKLQGKLRELGVSVLSCNNPKDDGSRLCGTTNVQGRIYNGSGDPCSQAAKASSGRFVHIEQSRGIRKDPARLIAALKAVYPPSPGR